MPQNFYQNISIASTVSYVTPTFDPEVLKNAKSKTDLDKHILSQTQGESVMLTEDYDLPSLMYITNLIYRSSPEMVFVTKEGLRVLVFDFTSDPVIRPAEIITSLSLLNKEVTTGKSEHDIKINVQEIWDKEISEDITQRLYTCLKIILKQALQTNKITLIGKEPSVLFLLTQHILATRTKELWYQSDFDSKPVRIY